MEVARRRTLLLAATVLSAALSWMVLAAPPSAAASSRRPAPAYADGLGVRPGKIKHVWLIILENKSYDATFTGLNNNTYLWRTLPSQGVLLKNYYGTGHFSFDNYISLASGQATQADTQVDCPYYDHFSGRVDTSGSLRRNPNYGQMTSAQGPNAAAGSNGCVYPSSVKTLFDQLDAAHVSWKGYAQDLGAPDPTPPQHSAGIHYCGAPYPSPGPTGSTAQPNPAVASATDQYLPKHFPFPWFESLLGSGRCDRAHIAGLFDPGRGLLHDLARKATTPAFSWITPNMCSDAHDAVCHGNNLSGGFSGPNTPRAPRNYTGGLYAADLFLRHIVPAIERSAAFRDGGLIDITFDEAFPPFTYTGNSFANSKIVPPNAATSIANDSAGETLFGRAVHFEPTGPNTPLAKNALGQELYPGPGDNAFVDRPGNCVAQTVPPKPRGTCLLGGGANVPGPRTDAGATAPLGSSTISDNAIVVTDMGRTVTGVGIPPGAVVGKVTNTPVMANAPNQNGGFAVAGSFALVGASGQALVSDRPGERDHGGAAHTGDRSTVQRHRPDDRRRRHRQRADQPVHQAGKRQPALLQPLQLAAHDGGPVQRRGPLSRPRRTRPPRLRGPAGTRSVWPRRVQQPARPASTAPVGHSTSAGSCTPVRRTRDSRSRETPSRLRSHTGAGSRRQSAPPCRRHTCSSRRRAPRARSRSRSRPRPARCRSAAWRSRSSTSRASFTTRGCRGRRTQPCRAGSLRAGRSC